MSARNKFRSKPEKRGLTILMGPQLPFPTVHSTTLNLKGNTLIWLRCDNQILKSFMCSLDLLFPRAHKPKPRLNSSCDLWKLELKKQTRLSRHGISHLRDLVSRSSNLHKVLLHVVLTAVQPSQQGGAWISDFLTSVPWPLVWPAWFDVSFLVCERDRSHR